MSKKFPFFFSGKKVGWSSSGYGDFRESVSVEE